MRVRAGIFIFMANLHTHTYTKTFRYLYELIISKKRINKFKIIHSNRVEFVEEEYKLKTSD